MCGLTGFLDLDHRMDGTALEATASIMANAIYHRGPDDGGAWADVAVGIAFASRRLAIVDLSPAGHQPMASVSGRFIIAFNGEIYNFEDLRQELNALAPSNALTWRGHSDTEVLLAAIEHWGLQGTLTRAIGMFALAVWDRQERVLSLARDRLGEKPIYYGWSGTTFLFGSELKAVRAHPAFRGEVDRDALALFLRHNYIADPWCIYRGFRKLVPGTILQVWAERSEAGHLPEPVAYWSANEVAEIGQRRPFTGSADQARERLDALLRDAVRRQMIADVPLGAFLSGGIDSSTIVALMQVQSTRPIKTFTIGFHEADYNEAAHAKEVARHLGTDHTELYVTPADAMAVIPKLSGIYDEPFADSSQIPTFLVSHLARQSVTVSLSGDGGDELFGGYNRYFGARRIWDKIGPIPGPLRHVVAWSASLLSATAWDGVFSVVRPILPRQLRRIARGDRIHRVAYLLGVEGPDALYEDIVSHALGDTRLAIQPFLPARKRPVRAGWSATGAFVHDMMQLDLTMYLPGDILAKVDRASMAVSLEARAPYLDHRVVEFAWQLPLSMKVRDGQGKWLLRRVLDAYVPRDLIERPKQGFGVPVDAWLRGPLREWAEALLEERHLRDEGFLQAEQVRRVWQEHCAGTHNWRADLWNVLMFQAWLADVRSGAPEAALREAAYAGGGW